MVWSITYVIRDEKGKQSSFTINVPGTLTVEAVTDFAIQFANLVAAVVTGKIVSIGLTLSVNLSNQTPLMTAQAGSDVEEKGYFQFTTENGFTTSFSIPTFDESKIVAGGNAIDTADADVAAIVDAMILGLTALDGLPGEVVVEPCDQRAEDVENLQTAIEVFMASGRARR